MTWWKKTRPVSLMMAACTINVSGACAKGKSRYGIWPRAMRHELSRRIAEIPEDSDAGVLPEDSGRGADEENGGGEDVAQAADLRRRSHAGMRGV